jgi:dTDP-4-amino-4,6-dideoxygalactose transaminase
MMADNAAEERGQNARKHLGYKKGDLAVSEELPNEVPSLPLFPELTPDRGIYIANRTRELPHT